MVEWSALLAPGGLRPFCISVIAALHYEANKTGMDRLLQCMFGPFYKSDVDSVESTPGAKNALFGAFLTFQVTGHATSVAGAMRNWVKFMSTDPFGGEMTPILGILSPFKKVNGIPSKALGTKAYAVDLGPGVISDALLAKVLAMVKRAAFNAAHDQDPAKSATVARVCFEFSEVSGNTSKLHSQARMKLSDHSYSRHQIMVWGISIPGTKPLVSLETQKNLVAQWRDPEEVWPSFRGPRAQYGVAARLAWEADSRQSDSTTSNSAEAGDPIPTPPLVIPTPASTAVWTNELWDPQPGTFYGTGDSSYTGLEGDTPRHPHTPAPSRCERK